MILHFWLTCLVLIFGVYSTVNAHFLNKDWETQQLYTRSDVQYYTQAIFPTIRQCKKSEDILIVQVKIQEPTDSGEAVSPSDEPSLTKWSIFANDYLFHNTLELEDDPEYAYLVNEYLKDYHYKFARYATFILLLLLIMFTLLGFFLIPIAGFIGYHILSFIICIFTCKPVRRLGRWIIIRREIMRRKRERYLLPILINKKILKHYYRVPHFFREHSDEDEPEELKHLHGTIAVHIKESSSEVSLDKLYEVLYKDGEPREDIILRQSELGVVLPPDIEEEVGTFEHKSRVQLTTDRLEREKMNKAYQESLVPFKPKELQVQGNKHDKELLEFDENLKPTKILNEPPNVKVITPPRRTTKSEVENLKNLLQGSKSLTALKIKKKRLTTKPTNSASKLIGKKI